MRECSRFLYTTIMPNDSRTPQPSATSAKPSRMAWVVRLVLVVLCITAAAWALNTWHTQRQTQMQLSKQLADITEQTQQLTQRLADASQKNTENTARITALETALEQRQRAAAWQQPSTAANMQGANEAALWFELQTRIHTAYQRAVLSGEDAALLRALHAAQQRSANHNNPQFSAVHQALTQDIAALQKSPAPKRQPLAAQLNSHIHTLHQLPLLSSQIPKLDANYKAPKPQTPKTGWGRFVQQLRRGLSQLVRVRTIHGTDSALISPEMGRFVREHTRLRLINARLALLLGQYAAANEDIQAAVDLINRYFDTQAPNVQASISRLNIIAQQLHNAKLPNIDNTLAALRLPHTRQEMAGN